MKIILHEKKTIQGGIPGLAVMERGIYSEGDEFKSRPYSFLNRPWVKWSAFPSLTIQVRIPKESTVSNSVKLFEKNENKSKRGCNFVAKIVVMFE